MEQQRTVTAPDPRIVDSVEQVTPDWLTDVLREVEVLRDGRVAGVAGELVSAGQVGLVARLRVDYDGRAGDAPRSMILKLAATDEGSRAMGTSLGIYEAEVRFYEQLADTVDIRVPLAYSAAIDLENGRFTMLLEDLADVGEVADMIAGGTVEQAAQVLQALVGLQAPRWNDATLGELPWLANPRRDELIFDGVEPALRPFLERFGDRLNPEDAALVQRIAPRARAWAAGLSRSPSVIVHGDCRLDNMVFPNDSAAPVAFFDWQTVRLGPALLDPAMYLGGCLDPEDRRQHEHELLRTFHDQLVGRGITGFPFEQLWQSYRYCLFYALFLSVPFSIQLEHTERGDALFASMVSTYSLAVRELDCESLLEDRG